MRARSLALSILLVAGAAACSDDGGGSDGDAQAYVDALASTLDDEDEGGPTAEQADCIAEETIDVIGVDTLEDEGITPEDVEASDGPDDLGIELSDDDATAVAQAFLDCDFSFVDALLASLAPDASSDDLRACVEDSIDDDLVLEGMVASLQGDDERADELGQELFGAIGEACPELLGG